MTGDESDADLRRFLALWRGLRADFRATLVAGAVALAEGREADFDSILGEARGRRFDSDDERPSED